jgi:hypothetical protein
MSINRLPVEILSKTFRFAFMVKSYRVWDPSGRRDVIRAVCFHWRDIIDCDRLAWSHIVIDNFTPLVDLHSWLVRVGGASIDFELNFEDPRTTIVRPGRSPSIEYREFLDWLMPTITPFLPQCRSLLIHSYHELASLAILQEFVGLQCPAMTSLIINVNAPSMVAQRLPSGNPSRICLPYLCNGLFPSLKEITFIKSLPLWTWTSSLLSVTTVRLSSMYRGDVPTVDEVHSFLRSTPNLVTLELRFVECSRRQGILDPPVLPYLTHLDFALIANSSSWLLSTLRMPSLRTITLDILDEEDLDYFIRHCAGVLAPVTTAILMVDFATYHQLADLLHALPSLIRMDARFSLRPFVHALQGVSLYWDNVCPNLSDIILAGPVAHSIVEDLILNKQLSNFALRPRIYTNIAGSSFVDGLNVKYCAHDSTVITSGVAKIINYDSMPVLM